MNRIPLACVLVMALAPPALAQSLVEVAKQEEARRSAVRAPSKVFTNSSLSQAPEQPPIAAPVPAPATTTAAPVSGNSSATATTASAPAAPTPAAPKGSQLDEKLWRTRAASFRAKVAQAQKEMNALAGASHADPREQAALDAMRTRRQAALNQAEEALRLFEMQADVAGVPSAWLLEPR